MGNGFTVNDDFRSYSDGASQQCLNSIKNGELPLELQGIFNKEEVIVKVKDKKLKCVCQQSLCSCPSRDRVTGQEVPHRKLFLK